MLRRRALAPQVSGRSLLAALLLALVFATGFVPVRPAAPVEAGTAETMEGQIVAWINADRVAHGLVPFRLHPGLVRLSGDRAAGMAAAGTLSHTIAGCLPCQVTSRGIQWYADGEDIGRTTYPFGSQAARSLYTAWKASPAHWTLLMGRTFNYVGVGVAYRASSATTYASIVMTESKDRTAPSARMVSGSASGTTVSWSWRGADPALQTHTSGLRGFIVQSRTDRGAWRTIRAGTTSRSLSIADPAPGHWYGLRVRARDGNGNLSGWTAELRVWVPAVIPALSLGCGSGSPAPACAPILKWCRSIRLPL